MRLAGEGGASPRIVAMAKRRTLADQERIRREVRESMAKPRGEPAPAAPMVGFAPATATPPEPAEHTLALTWIGSAPTSTCCGAAVRITEREPGNSATIVARCAACGEPYDAV